MPRFGNQLRCLLLAYLAFAGCSKRIHVEVPADYKQPKTDADQEVIELSEWDSMNDRWEWE